jgi:hypothetical protein
MSSTAVRLIVLGSFVLYTAFAFPEVAPIVAATTPTVSATAIASADIRLRSLIILSPFLALHATNLTYRLVEIEA